MHRILAVQNKKKAEIPFEATALSEFIKQKNAFIWIDLEQPNEEELGLIQQAFELHPLSMEDCRNQFLFPKIDSFPHYLFIVLHRFVLENRKLRYRELDCFLNNRFVITLCNETSQGVNKTRERYDQQPDRLAKGCELVLHHILDYNTDALFTVLTEWSNDIDALETQVLNQEHETHVNLAPIILKHKKHFTRLKKALTDQADVIRRLSRREFPQISEHATLYYSDVHNHLLRIINELDDYRDSLANLFEAHLSVLSTRMNEQSVKLNDVMKKLTVISTIFLPLTFITSLYGMNFTYMPELDHPLGYFLVWILIVFIALGMLYYFRKKNWF